MSAANISFETCMPHEAHARLILDWRNDEDTLKASFNSRPRTWEEFWPEYIGNYFGKPDCPGPWFSLADGHRCGFVSLQPCRHPHSLRGTCALVSINIAPDFRGKGLANHILEEAATQARRAGLSSLYAEIKENNPASRKAFERAGFVEIPPQTSSAEHTGRGPVHRYLRELISPFWREGPVKIIAEAGSNWRMGTPARDMAMAHTLIDVAADAGADYVKFQTYRPETTYVKNAGASDYLSDAGIKSDISEIFADLAMPYEMISDLSAYCRKKSVEFMSTPFSIADFEAIDPFVDVHKIASYEISHVHLLELAARSGKPLVLSTGASNRDDIAWAVKTFEAAGGRDLCLLQCTSKYPAPLSSLNLRTIPWIIRHFGTPSGLSDHSQDPAAGPAAAVALGASVIEKHYTLDKRLPGPDHPFALDPDELKQMIDAIRSAEQTLGSGVKDVQSEENELAAFARRGIQAIREIDKGETLIEDDAFAILRPGKNPLGAHPMHLADIAGKQASRKITLGEGIHPHDCD